MDPREAPQPRARDLAGPQGDRRHALRDGVSQALRQKNPDYEEYLRLLVDEDLWTLLAIPFSAELAKLTRELTQPAIPASTQSRPEQKRTTTAGAADETIIREAIARELNKPASELVDSDCAQVTRLNLSLSKLSDLTPLKGLTSLQELYLDGTHVTDLTALQGLTSLQRLWLNQTQVSDLTPLHGLTDLIVLYLNGTRVSDLTALEGLTSLRELYLNQTRVSDLTALRVLTSLHVLSLEWTQISDEQVAELKRALPKLTIVR
jgi:Leucine-rich repeat (LRR) protein